jgi:hypothetical protein
MLFCRSQVRFRTPLTSGTGCHFSAMLKLSLGWIDQPILGSEAVHSTPELCVLSLQNCWVKKLFQDFQFSQTGEETFKTHRVEKNIQAFLVVLNAHVHDEAFTPGFVPDAHS